MPFVPDAVFFLVIAISSQCWTYRLFEKWPFLAYKNVCMVSPCLLRNSTRRNSLQGVIRLDEDPIVRARAPLMSSNECGLLTESARNVSRRQSLHRPPLADGVTRLF